MDQKSNNKNEEGRRAIILDTSLWDLTAEDTSYNIHSSSFAWEKATLRSVGTKPPHGL